MSSSLNGPRLPAASGRADSLVVFLHGYGADGNDLIDLGRSWQKALPNTAFVSPHAPEPCGMSPMGRQWFALTMRDRTERWRGVTKARPTLDAFLDSELASLGLDASRLALVGFSQGTMMALHVGLRRPVAPLAILGFSGMLVLEDDKRPEALAAQISVRPPVFLIHGDRDEVIPVDALFMATEALASADIPCEWHISLGLGHGIDGEGLRQGGEFLRTRLRRSQ